MSEITLPENIARIKIELEANEEKIQGALPQHIIAKDYICNVWENLLVSKGGAELLEKGSLGSVLVAVLHAARMGLWLDGYDAALVPRQGRIVCSPMVWGLVRLCRQHPEIANVASGVVKERDTCDLYAGADPNIQHRIYTEGPRGEITGAYAIAWLVNGNKQIEWLGIEEMSKFQQSYTEVYDKWPEEMLPIRTLRRLIKKLPRSTVASEALIRADYADPRAEDPPDADPDTKPEQQEEDVEQSDAPEKEQPQEEQKPSRSEVLASKVERGRRVQQRGSKEEPEGFMDEGNGQLPM